MSYEPNIFFRKKDIEKYRDEIENAEWDIIARMPEKTEKQKQKRDELERVYRDLKWALDGSTIKFDEVELVMISPEGTLHNNRIREMLMDLEIEYKVNN